MDVSQLQKEATGVLDKIRCTKSNNFQHRDASDGSSFSCGLLPHRLRLRQKYLLEGHMAKVYAIHWGADSSLFTSVAQDGKMIVWDGDLGLKLNRVNTPSMWELTCAIARSGKFVATGGLSCKCSIYRNTGPGVSFELVHQFSGHQSCISCCRFVNNHHLLSSSTDSTIVFWDTKESAPVATFKGHSGEVNAVEIAPSNRTFVSVGNDAEAKLWDLREKRHVQSFVGHEADINAVALYPTGDAFITGSDDCTCKLFDVRSPRHCLSTFNPRDSAGCITSVAISKTGKLLLAGNDISDCDVWDIFTEKLIGTLDTNSSRVSCVTASSDGLSFASGSWDHFVRIWK